MVQRAKGATPNLALFNLRESLGQSQQDVADAINDLARKSGKNVAVTANQVSRWELGKHRPIPLYRQLLAEHFGVTVDQLGLTDLRDEAGPATPVVDVTSLGGLVAPPVAPDAKVESSQNEWRAVRRALNSLRAPLARTVACLYEQEQRHGETGLITTDRWMPSHPIPLNKIRIEKTPTSDPDITGSDPRTAAVRPLASLDRRYHRYSQAIRGLDHPRLFENRHAWRLADINLKSDVPALAFGDTSYFDQTDITEAVAHEAAQHLVNLDGRIKPASWRGLSLRRAIGDPFNLGRRALAVSVDTITIRRDRDGASFVLHQRNAGDVAAAGGMLHVMPCGVFQPSSIHPAALAADFSLWRNVQREYSEEFLGNPEHDGSGSSVDYDVPPFSHMQQAINEGKLRVYCLGAGLDALTLFGEILTAAVFDGDLYDELFAGMVDVNEEGAIVKTGRVHPTSAIPFNEHTVRELLDSGRMAPAGAACLDLAWRHRREILG